MSFLHSLTLPCSYGPASFSSSRILLTTNILTGLGDVAATVKLLAIFKKYVATDRLALCVHKEDFERFHFFEKEIQDIKKIVVIDSPSAEDIEKDRDKISSFNPSLVISFNRGTPFRSELFTHPVPGLGVKEYGYHNVMPDEYYHSHRFVKSSLGLRCSSGMESLDAMGLFQDPSLIEYYHDKRNQDASHRCMTYLPQLSQKLLQALFDDDEKKGSFKERVAHFSQTSKLYFGYVGEYFDVNYIKAFIGAMILQTPSCPKKECHLTFVLPGSKCDSKEIFSKHFRLFLLEHGFSYARCIFEDEHRRHEYLHEKIDLSENKQMPGRCLTVFRSMTTHEDFLLLMKASEDEVLGTGDHSISEELSAGKKVYYQELPHKKKFAHDLSNMISKICKVELDFCPQNFTGARFHEIAAIEWMRVYFDKLKRSNWDDVICEIHRNHNVEKRILSIMSKMESIL
jgi:hypothetical protein